jgi:Cys-tRNA(Pro)/Cys-tRNA(Cys) deacylase
MAPQREAERITGLLVGGISPLALLGRPFEVYLDARVAALERLYINGGQRGVNLRLRVADLLAVTGAQLVAATTPARLSDKYDAKLDRRPLSGDTIK